ncbi:MAG: HYExAFE family protein [Planctomycetota bacterium]
MGQARHHYERAFESYLRARRTPYVSVNEARRALLPAGSKLTAVDPAGERVTLKNFDFVIYGSPTNLLVEVKGRRVGREGAPPTTASRSRLQSWVTLGDVAALRRWQGLFGEGFRGAFVFLYWCAQQPPDALFQEVFEHEGRWYAVRAVTLDEYESAMVTRSARWKTVHVPTDAFERISGPLASAAPGVPRRISSAPVLQREMRRTLGACT